MQCIFKRHYLDLIYIIEYVDRIYARVSGEFRIKPVPHKPFPHMRNRPSSVCGIGQIVNGQYNMHRWSNVKVDVLSLSSKKFLKIETS